MDSTHFIGRERSPGDLKQLLINVFQAQEDLVYTQQEAMMKLLHENAEQENMINVMMREHVD